MIKRILKLFSIFLLIVFLGASSYVYTTTPALPEGTKETIKTLINQPTPDMIKGETGYVTSEGLKIWYENIAPKTPEKGTFLFIMGAANDGLAWPSGFVQTFVDAGYRVIRFDHRGTGMSDWVKDWDRYDPYSLSNMAGDCVAILDQLGLEKVHVLGISLGGMIGQELAIHHSDRVSTLTSVMSSGFVFDQSVPPFSKKTATKLIKIILKYGLLGGEENTIKLYLAVRLTLMGEANHGVNTEEIANHVLYNLRERKGFNKMASQQHMAAAEKSGSRLEMLKDLEVPTLVIHGEADPLIPIAHGKKLAALVPGADSLWLDMGHDLPVVFWEDILEKVDGFVGGE